MGLTNKRHKAGSDHRNQSCYSKKSQMKFLTLIRARQRVRLWIQMGMRNLQIKEKKKKKKLYSLEEEKKNSVVHFSGSLKVNSSKNFHI